MSEEEAGEDAAQTNSIREADLFSRFNDYNCRFL